MSGPSTPARASALLALLCVACAGLRTREVAAVGDVLDDFHQAASNADEQRYMGHFASEAVFLGTDGSERWTREEFREYVHAFFSVGRGWTYRPRDRHVAFSADGRVAWFDELLDNENYGECRGSGVLTRTLGGWKILQYNLTLTVPNDVAASVVELIAGSQAAPAPGDDPP